ncbi:PKD domain-containing protein [Flavobacterium poyangense]|uniref:PKD domain-containing protein n=1 Tax=Flavobacterium poyangense TaxID=2204302 RepID=UPI00141FB61F|nr:PKD domain-containing protein [Flavobacterium sp. JXAS1]
MGSILQNTIFGRTKNDFKTFKFTIDTNLGEGTSFTIPTRGGLFSYSVKWGDGITTSGHTGNATHIYTNPGIYQIEIKGTFPRIFFNNTGDRLKIKSVDQWGEVGWATIQSAAFWGCENLTNVANDMTWINSLITGSAMFFNTKIAAFPEGVTFGSLVTANDMFNTTDFTALPSTVTFANLVDGSGMFRNSKITTFPNTVTFSALIYGGSMFHSSSLSSLPSSVTFASLTNADGMFWYGKITTFTTNITFADLTTGAQMFRSSLLTSLPNTVTFANIVNCKQMFWAAPITTLPNTITFSKLTNGENMFYQVTLNKARYSQLLIDLNTYNVSTGLRIDGGLSKYDASGRIARNALTSRSPAWQIIDGGFEA